MEQSCEINAQFSLCARPRRRRDILHPVRNDDVIRFSITSLVFLPKLLANDETRSRAFPSRRDGGTGFGAAGAIARAVNEVVVQVKKKRNVTRFRDAKSVKEIQS